MTGPKLAPRRVGHRSAKKEVIRLERERLDRVVGAIAGGHEAGVERAVRSQPGDAIARGPVDGREPAPDDDFAIGLHGERVDIIIGAEHGAGCSREVPEIGPGARRELQAGAGQ